MIRVDDFFFFLAKIGTVTCVYVSVVLGVMLVLLAICFVILPYIVFKTIITVFYVRCCL
jgi:hypothetical protein